MSDVRHWYAHVRWLPCEACGAMPPSEIAHVRCLLSKKTGMVLPRSHKGRAAWSCIALCPDCHRLDSDSSIHAVGEARFAEERRLDYGRIIATRLIEFFAEGKGN